MQLQIQQVFEHWKIVLQHDRARLDTKRTRMISSALAWGYSVEDLQLAIEGCAGSPFHMGDNDRNTIYDGLDLILRDADKIDRFMASGEQLRAKIRRNIERRRAQLQAADIAGNQTKTVADEYLTELHRLLGRKVPA